MEGAPALAGTRVVQAVRSESVAGGGCFAVLWHLECPVGLNQKINMCAFQPVYHQLTNAICDSADNK